MVIGYLLSEIVDLRGKWGKVLWIRALASFYRVLYN